MNPEVSKYMSELGKKSAASLTKEQRTERAKKAIKTRWANKKKKDAEDEKSPD